MAARAARRQYQGYPFGNGLRNQFGCPGVRKPAQRRHRPIVNMGCGLFCAYDRKSSRIHLSVLTDIGRALTSEAQGKHRSPGPQPHGIRHRTPYAGFLFCLRISPRTLTTTSSIGIAFPASCIPFRTIAGRAEQHGTSISITVTLRMSAV